MVKSNRQTAYKNIGLPLELYERIRERQGKYDTMVSVIASALDGSATDMLTCSPVNSPSGEVFYSAKVIPLRLEVYGKTRTDAIANLKTTLCAWVDSHITEMG